MAAQLFQSRYHCNASGTGRLVLVNSLDTWSIERDCRVE
jgi:hypothetical protein